MEEEVPTETEEDLQQAALLFQLLGIAENTIRPWDQASWLANDNEDEAKAPTIKTKYQRWGNRLEYKKRRQPILKYEPPKKKGRQLQPQRPGVGTPCGFDFLSEELVLHIFSYLRPKELLAVSLVGRRFLCISLDNTLWQSFTSMRWPTARQRETDSWWMTFEACVARECLKIIFANNTKGINVKVSWEVFDYIKPAKKGNACKRMKRLQKRDSRKAKWSRSRKRGEEDSLPKWKETTELPMLDISAQVKDIWFASNPVPPIESLERIVAEATIVASLEEGGSFSEKLEDFLLWSSKKSQWLLDPYFRVQHSLSQIIEDRKGEPIPDVVQLCEPKEVSPIEFTEVSLRADIRMLSSVMKCLIKLKKSCKRKKRDILRRIDAHEAILEDSTDVDDFNIGKMLNEIYQEFSALPEHVIVAGLQHALSEISKRTDRGSIYRFMVGILNGANKLPSWEKAGKTFKKRVVAYQAGGIVQEVPLFCKKMTSFNWEKDFSVLPEDFDVDGMKQYGRQKETMRKLLKMMNSFEDSKEESLMKATLDEADAKEEGEDEVNEEIKMELVLFEWMEVISIYLRRRKVYELRETKEKLDTSFKKMHKMWQKMRAACDL